MGKAFIFILSKINGFYGIFLMVGFIGFINLTFLNQSFAKDVIYEKPIKFALKDGGYWVSRVHFFEGIKTLEVFTDVSLAKNKLILSAEISECSFCRGNEDNCAQDGIDILEVSLHSRPIVTTVCHVGAHSQKLMIFDPQQNKNKPVLQRTGAYSLTLSQRKEKLSFSYDQFVDGSKCPDATDNLSGFCVVSGNWP